MIDLSLDEGQQEIVTSAADFLREAAPVSRLRAPGADTALHRALAEWGWFHVGAAEADGGLGLGPVEEALLYVEAGRQLVAPSVLATALAAALGPDDLREAMRTGAARAIFALPAGADAVLALEREGAALIVVPGEADVRFFRASDFGGERVEGFDEALSTERGRIAAPALLTVEASARATLLLAALLAGNAAGAAESAIAYAKVREQFGQPIGAFQAIKHRCADMGVAAFAASAQVTMAAACLAEHAPQTPTELAAAVRIAVKSAQANAAAAIQVHGGMGFTAECDAHRYLKRAHVLARLLGDPRRTAAALLASG